MTEKDLETHMAEIDRNSKLTCLRHDNAKREAFHEEAVEIEMKKLAEKTQFPDRMRSKTLMRKAGGIQVPEPPQGDQEVQEEPESDAEEEADKNMALEKDDRAPEPEAAPIVIDVDEARNPVESVEKAAEAEAEAAPELPEGAVEVKPA